MNFTDQYYAINQHCWRQASFVLFHCVCCFRFENVHVVIGMMTGTQCTLHVKYFVGGMTVQRWSTDDVTLITKGTDMTWLLHTPDTISMITWINCIQCLYLFLKVHMHENKLKRWNQLFWMFWVQIVCFCFSTCQLFIHGSLYLQSGIGAGVPKFHTA